MNRPERFRFLQGNIKDVGNVKPQTLRFRNTFSDFVALNYVQIANFVNKVYV